MGEVVRKEITVKDRVVQFEVPEEFEGKSVEAIARLKRNIEKEMPKQIEPLE